MAKAKETVSEEYKLRQDKLKKHHRKSLWKDVRRDWQLYLLLLVPLAFVIIFNYAAYPGLRIAFMDYKPALGYDKSKWVGFGTFIKTFNDPDFVKSLRNSLVFKMF